MIAHPGHELRVFGWASQVHPLTAVLTRGDGSISGSRLSSTTKVLEAVGATAGPVYGRFSDREIYDLLLHGQTGPLLEVRDALAESFVAAGISVVACDAEEWYNPSHDVCRYLTVSAAHRASRRIGRVIQVFDFPLIGLPDTCPDDMRASAIRVELDDELFDMKLENARCYPELRIEVERALAVNGAEAFRVECLRPVTAPHAAPPSVPFYELYGERQVQAGHYTHVIRYDPHVAAVRDALRDEPRKE